MVLMGCVINIVAVLTVKYNVRVSQVYKSGEEAIRSLAGDKTLQIKQEIGTIVMRSFERRERRCSSVSDCE